MKLARFLCAILFASVVISGCGKKEGVLGIKTIDVDFRNRSVDMPAGIPVMDIVGAHNIVVSADFFRYTVPIPWAIWDHSALRDVPETSSIPLLQIQIRSLSEIIM